MVGAIGGESGSVLAVMVDVSWSSLSSGLAKEEANQEGENKKGGRAEIEARRAHCYHDQLPSCFWPFSYGFYFGVEGH